MSEQIASYSFVPKVHGSCKTYALARLEKDPDQRKPVNHKTPEQSNYILPIGKQLK